MSVRIERHLVSALFIVALLLLLPERAAAQAYGTLRQQNLGQQSTGQMSCQDSSGSQTSGSTTGNSSSSLTTSQPTNALLTASPLQRRQQLLAQLQALNQQQAMLNRQFLATPRFGRR
jgi:hypothetical protein